MAGLDVRSTSEKGHSRTYEAGASCERIAKLAIAGYRSRVDARLVVVTAFDRQVVLHGVEDGHVPEKRTGEPR